ncbi:MAG: thioredoxin family protein [Wenyingzhuangia sp.]|jgi:thioredoxin 1|uniref:thioredoxin family protein n=1 Tax=Wenyingzhuangia sp. TaxID=1964193 RepID=UPI00321BE77C
MTKFGDLINVEMPVLIDFYAQWSEEEEETGVVLNDVVAALGDKAKVMKIDIAKNETLVNALKVKANPTFLIYKNGELKWRQSGEQDANTLIAMVQQYV